ncbi:hypothetical protein BT93_H0452 [Corymbia citriodora subsp. variegata]|nr:hypothetical protein BT93_H0452 [Corymbia citriodora subsp. variegata]
MRYPSLSKKSNKPTKFYQLKAGSSPSPTATRIFFSGELQRPLRILSPSFFATTVESRSSSDVSAPSNMSLLFNTPTFAPQQKLRKPDLGDRTRLHPPSRSPFFSTERRGIGGRRDDYRRNGVRAFFFNPTEERIIREALKEPVAFMGGMFAGILRLDLNEDPLREWVTRTVEASGISPEELDAEGSKETKEDAPQQIEIE